MLAHSVRVRAQERLESYFKPVSLDVEIDRSGVTTNLTHKPIKTTRHHYLHLIQVSELKQEFDIDPEVIR